MNNGKINTNNAKANMVPSQLRGKATAFNPPAQGTSSQIPAQVHATVGTSQSSVPNSAASQASLSGKFDNMMIRCPPTGSALDQDSEPSPPTTPNEDFERKLNFFDDTYATSAGIGTVGSTFPVRVNRLQMCASGVPPLRQYRVAFTPLNKHEVTNKRIKKLMIEETLRAIGVDTNPLVSTDWNDLLITRQQDLATLANDQLRPHPSGDGTYNVTIDFPSQTQRSIINIRPETQMLDKGEFDEHLRGNRPANFNYGPYTTALNILTRHYAAQNAVCIGSNRIFPLTGQLNGLGQCGLHPRLGFYVSVRPSDSVQLQLNPSASAFFDPIDLVEFFRRYLRNAFNPANPNLEALREAQIVTQKLQVRCKWRPQGSKAETNKRWPIIPDGQVLQQGRLKRICAYGPAASAQMFNDGSTQWSVRDYFNQRVLSSPLRFPGLPVANVGNYDNPIWVPMELLRITPHQNLRSPLRATEMDNMANFSRRGPLDNVSRIEGGGLSLLDHARLTNANPPIVSISPTLMEVNGRKLPMPRIGYKKGETSGDDLRAMADGKWTLINKEFYQSANLPELLVIQIGKSTVPAQDMKSFANSLTTYGILVNGGKGPRPYRIQNAPTTSADDLTAAYKRLDRPAIRTVLVILATDTADPYAAVKSWGELEAGVNTICVTPKKIRSLGNKTFQANLALKFNVKLGSRKSGSDPFLGGKNQVIGKDTDALLHPPNELTMVVGADVTHPGPSSVPFCPSIAAVVASTDRHCANFPGSMRLQPSRQEDIEHMREMMFDRLDVWYRQNKKLPSRILFYRDGVSEDQFATVKQNELPKIRLACDDAAAKYKIPSYKPPITLVVCTKRHYTRFFPPKKTTANDNQHINLKDMNFKPGLVVDDRSIRLPKYFDFWLQAHAALQGTARPCHYFVLENGMNLLPDTLQQVTFALSFVYATSLTPISLVAPAYYADKICERGRCYIRSLLSGSYQPRRAIETLLQAAPAGTTEAQKKNRVLQMCENGAGGVWRSQMVRPNNPCHDAVKDTMFFI